MNVLQVIISARAPLRFSRIQDLCAISATSLSRRLKELEKAGLVRRYSHNTIPLTVEYQATQVAFELEPTLRGSTVGQSTIERACADPDPY